MADMTVRNPPAEPRTPARPASAPPQPASKPANTVAPTAARAPATARSGESIPSGFDTRAARTGGDTGIVPKAAVQLGTPEAPVKRAVTFIYDAGPHDLTNLQLKGSWDANGKLDPSWQGGASIPMKPLGDGRWAATVELSDDGQNREFQWGVTADGANGKGQWALMGESNQRFQLGPNAGQQSYSPTTYHYMGVHRVGKDGASFKFWAPEAKDVTVKITDKNGRVQRMPMTRAEDGVWSAADPKGWAKVDGKAYVYEITDPAGNKLERTDPYARRLQGEQRGLGRMYIDPASGQETHPFTPNRMELMRFEIDDEPKASEAYLVLKDAGGRPLSKQQLLDRLGTIDPALVSSARNGKFNDLWSENILPDGRIKLTQVDGAFTTVVNDVEKLAGLRYEFRAYSKDPQTGKLSLIGDTNHSGRFSRAEAKASNYNDPWSDVLTTASGLDPRGGVIADTSFDFKSDAAPREKDPSKWVVYQMHMGSFMASGQNVQRSTFEDAMAKLDYFKELGVNTIELLPVNEFEGNRDWGYMGANTMSVESSYGFEDENGKWVSGDEALKRFVDMAHSKGLNVVNDVVYNHIGGNYNDMWNLDGEGNPYFNWATEPGKMERRDTPWGPLPAYENPKVKQFFVDHAVAQVEDYHFDGLRFDFTEPIKGTGGKEGWEFLREVNRQVHFYKPELYTVAEQFDYDPAISEPAGTNGSGGGGFNAQWYTEYQHRLVHDNDNPGIVQAAANGWHTNMDAFVNLLTQPRGLTDWRKGLQMISNHDEVGNAERTIHAAQPNGPKHDEFPPQWSRDAARFTAGIGLTGPGTPMFFQGDESMASNPFKWGSPNTWDLGWDWQKLSGQWDFSKLTFNDNQKAKYERLFEVPEAQRQGTAEYQALSAADRKVFDDLAKMPASQRGEAMLNITRQQTFSYWKDAIALRNSSPAFQAGAEVKRIYSHNDNSVMAYERKSGLEDYIVVGSLNRNAFQGYGIELPPGQWKEVFNSDAASYGGNNVGNYGATVNGGQTQLNIPSAGLIVLKKVG